MRTRFLREAGKPVRQCLYVIGTDLWRHLALLVHGERTNPVRGSRRSRAQVFLCIGHCSVKNTFPPRVRVPLSNASMPGTCSRVVRRVAVRPVSAAGGRRKNNITENSSQEKRQSETRINGVLAFPPFAH